MSDGKKERLGAYEFEVEAAWGYDNYRVAQGLNRINFANEQVMQVRQSLGMLDGTWWRMPFDFTFPMHFI